MALLIDPTRPKVTGIRNLGWLRTNWRSIKEFKSTVDSGSQWFGAWLFAYTHDGRIYACTWASVECMHIWLKRPIFYGLKFNGETITRREHV